MCGSHYISIGRCLFFLISLLEYNCFTTVCQFLLYNKLSQLYVYIYIPISPPPCVSLPPSLSHPSRWSQSTELISLCYAVAPHQLAILHLVDVYMFMPISHFVPAYPSLSPCHQVHCLHLHLYSCPAPRFLRTIFKNRFHIYVLAYGICFSLLT